MSGQALCFALLARGGGLRSFLLGSFFTRADGFCFLLGAPVDCLAGVLLPRPKRRPAGQTAVFNLLQTTLYFDLHRSNACCLLHSTTSEDPEQFAVFNSPVLQQ